MAASEIRKKLRILSHSLEKSLMENFISFVYRWLPLAVIGIVSLKNILMRRNQDNDINYSRPFVQEFLYFILFWPPRHQV